MTFMVLDKLCSTDPHVYGVHMGVLVHLCHAKPPWVSQGCLTAMGVKCNPVHRNSHLCCSQPLQ